MYSMQCVLRKRYCLQNSYRKRTFIYSTSLLTLDQPTVSITCRKHSLINSKQSSWRTNTATRVSQATEESPCI